MEIQANMISVLEEMGIVGLVDITSPLPAPLEVKTFGGRAIGHGMLLKDTPVLEATVTIPQGTVIVDELRPGRRHWIPLEIGGISILSCGSSGGWYEVNLIPAN